MPRRLDGLPILSGPLMTDDLTMESERDQGSRAGLLGQYRSFADATRAVLDLLERHMPGRDALPRPPRPRPDIHRIVDTRNGGEFGLRSNLALPLATPSTRTWPTTAAPRLCNDVAKHARLRPRRRRSGASAPPPTSACRSSSPTARASARWPRWPRVLRLPRRATSSSSRCSRACSPPSSSARATSATCAASTTRCAPRRAAWPPSAAPRRRSPPATTPRTRDPRGGLRGRRRAGRLPARALRPRARLDRDARRRDGAGHDPGARGDAARRGARVLVAGELLRRRRRASTRRWRRRWSRPPTRARRCSSPSCARAHVAGVIIVIWRETLEAAPDAPSGVLRLLAAQAAAAIEHAGAARPPRRARASATR